MLISKAASKPLRAWCGIFKTEGIILKASPLSEADLILTIYTSGYGKISARAISARKKRSKLKGFLQPFSLAKFSFAKSRTIDIITEVQPINNFLVLKRDLKLLAYAFYFSELLDKLIIGPERDERIWKLAWRAFEVLEEENKDLPEIKKAFENKLLQFLGYGILNENNNLKRLNYFQNLAGERINSAGFLGEVGKRETF